MSAYQDFLIRKTQDDTDHGFDPVWVPEFLFEFQRDLVTWATRKGHAALFEDCGTGKLAPLDEPVLTPGGWSTMGEVAVGDQVIGGDGKPVDVIGVFPQGEMDIVRVTFSDGSWTRCGWDHLWSVQTQTQKARAKGFTTMTTREIADRGFKPLWQVPMVGAVHHEPTPLPIEPYLLGVLLGDGGLGYGIEITTDTEILENLRLRGRVVEHKSEGIATQKVKEPALSAALESMNLLGKRSWEKTVPPIYLLGHPEDRLAFLQGLMDTDGYPMPKGGAEFCSTSESMVDAVVEIVRSLGGVARGRRVAASTFTYKGVKKKGRRAERVNLKLPADLPMFRLSRKLAKHKPPTMYHPTRVFRSIEPDGRAEAVCIKVANPDGLYVTRDHIVTHNTPQQLVWAENVLRKTGRPVLLVAPLAVTFQTLGEAEKFGIDAAVSRDGKITAGITITNYDRLHLFDPADVAGMVADESSAIKSFDSERKALVTQFMRKLPYRLLCTATAAPNDYMELGTSSEALGYLGYQDMLSRWFTQREPLKHTKRGAATREQWRFKGHAEQPFWRWVASWARAMRTPSDLGYSDDGFIRPPVTYRQHVVEANAPADGRLFDVPAARLFEEREESRRTITERCEKAAELLTDAPSAVAWCQLNDEGDLLTKLIDGAVQVKGSDTPDQKEEALLGFGRGDFRVLVTKPAIGAWGMNWQHCHRTTYFPSHSYEQFYQSVRRFDRFGQQNPVTVDVVTTEGGRKALANLQRKSVQADRMYDSLVAHMKDAQAVTRSETYDKEARIPAWL